jgi:hypothetical protein
MKILLLQLVLVLFLVSCKTSNPVSSLTAKVDRSTQAGLKGDWRISKVSYPGSDFLNVNSFQIADAKCFEGSVWNFIPNNNKGSMTLDQNGCSSFSSSIVWSINKDGNFILKFLNPGVKAKSVNQGYVLGFVNQSEDTFQLIDNIQVGGQNKQVVYQFIRI